MEKVWWQAEVASVVASAITRCRSDSGRRGGSIGDIWLLFAGPDRVGKRKTATVLAEEVCRSTPLIISLGMRQVDGMKFRGKTVIDLITEAVQRNPFSLIVLEDTDEADMVVQGCLKQAMDRGRIADSHGREVSLGNAIFVLTGYWSTTDENIASKKLKPGLLVTGKSSKRRVAWLQEEDRPLKVRKEQSSVSKFDLNLDADEAEDEKTDDHDTSCLTTDHEGKNGRQNVEFSVISVFQDLLSNMDASIVFKPVDSALVRKEIKTDFEYVRK